MKSYKNKKNNNIGNDYLLSPKNEISKNEQLYYLNKYHKMFGNSIADVELLDIFAKNNYNDKLIMEDLTNLLSIGNVKKYDNYNNYNSYERNHKKSKSKSRGKKNKYEKRPFQKCIEIPSDYAPPPKKEEEEEKENDLHLNNVNKIGSEEKDKENNNNIKSLTNNDINEKNIICKTDLLLSYKEMFVRKLKNVDNTYKSNQNKKDEINVDNILKSGNNKKINLIENNQKIKIENNSPGPECLPYKKTKVYQNINKDLKKKYMRDFFGNMKNYTNNIRRANWEKSPDLNRREIILDSSPDKGDLYDRKVLTYKKGFKNYYSNDLISNKKKEYKILKIEKKINNIFISACYDNPQREQYLKIINEKRKQNPDKVIEFLIPQIPPMFPPLQPYPNMYTSYNQYNPYMNMYIMPPPQFSIQNPNPIINNIPTQSINNNIGNDKNNSINNNIEKSETPENNNILTQTQIMQLNNNNQINVKINNTPNPNALLLNNNDNNNSKSNKSSGNVSSSGNNNIDANIHL